MSLAIKDQYDKIYQYCYFKVKNAPLAEDLTQDTFLKFFSQNTYISKGKPLAYLYTIAKNLCIDAYRKKGWLVADEPTDDIPARDDLEDVATNIAVKQAVCSLPPDLQEIMLLRFANELSVSEVSSITGLSRFAVHRKINKALSQLQLLLRKEDFT